MAGLGKNELTIRFDTDTVVARWGQPFVVLTLGVDYGF
jgi:hypothetical protein